jgi:hypothetical protein
MWVDSSYKEFEKTLVEDVKKKEIKIIYIIFFLFF